MHLCVFIYVRVCVLSGNNITVKIRISILLVHFR